MTAGGSRAIARPGVVALSGGIGGAKLALGLSRVLPPGRSRWSPIPATISSISAWRSRPISTR